MNTIKSFLTLCFLSAGLSQGLGSEPWVVYEGLDGPGHGREILFVTGDEEYRSEEAMPMLAQILARHHGFKCTVLFAINPSDGTIDPNNQTHIPGLEALQTADMMVIFTRFRKLPDESMRYIEEYLNSGKPILGLRTATHAFNYPKNSESRYAHYGFRSKEWPGGFGQQVLGETWVTHHGRHGHESTRGLVNSEQKDHPILRGVGDVWGPTDVYAVKNLPSDATVLLWGQVLEGMKPTDAPVEGKKNNPMMPLAWIRPYSGKAGKTSRIITTTMGAATDLESEGLRRFLVNAVYWGVGLEDEIPARSKVDYVSAYQPSQFGFGKFRPGLKPASLAW